MTVHFVYRSPYDNPAGFHHRAFDDDTVLAWFQRVWREVAAGQTAPSSETLIGRDVYGFDCLLQDAADGAAPPVTADELRAVLRRRLYITQDEHFLMTDHCVQVYTDDDEVELAIYVFDDYYFNRRRARAAFLAHGDAPLPSTSASRSRYRSPRDCVRDVPTRVKGAQAVYIMFQDYGGMSLECPAGCFRVRGVRLPDFWRWLARTTPDEDEWPGNLLSLHECLFPATGKVTGMEEAFVEALRANPADRTSWGAYADWLEEQGQPGPGVVLLREALLRLAQDADTLTELLHPSQPDPTKSRIRVEEHVAQAWLHTNRWTYPSGRSEDVYVQMTFFDDLWAAAHPDLAGSILRFGSRWDPLTVDETA